MRCVIICGGDFSPALLPEKKAGELWIAADSGLRHLQNARVTPDLAIGDWDSLGTAPEGLETVTLQVRKDDTDLVAAARLGYEKGCRSFLILGALGGKRFSHSIAALQALHWLKTLGAVAEILDENCRIFCLGAGETQSFAATETGHLSVFALTEQAAVNLRGLWYSAEKVTLQSAFPLGVSNAFVGKTAEVACESGVVAVVTEQAE